MKSKEIYDHVERLANLLRSESRQVGIPYGMQPIQLEALRYLSICNRYSDTPMAVTEYLNQTKGTVSQTLKLLEKKNFLIKTTDSNDKRITHLKVSSKGNKLLQKLIPTPVYTQVSKKLSESTQTQIINSLKELLQVIQQENEMKSFGVCNTCRYNQKIKSDSHFCGLTQEPLSKVDISLICREHESVVE